MDRQVDPWTSRAVEPGLVYRLPRKGLDARARVTTSLKEGSSATASAATFLNRSKDIERGTLEAEGAAAEPPRRLTAAAAAAWRRRAARASIGAESRDSISEIS
jgi:hypothetical protein